MANEIENFLLIKGKNISEIDKYIDDNGALDFDRIIPLKDETTNDERIDAWGVKWKSDEFSLRDSSKNYRVYSFYTPWNAPDKIIWKLQELHPNWLIQNFWIHMGEYLGIVYGDSEEFDGNAMDGWEYTLEGYSELLKDHLDYSFCKSLTDFCNGEVKYLQEILDEEDREEEKKWMQEDLIFYQKLKELIESEWKLISV